MKRAKLLFLQAMVMVVALLIWHVVTAYPIWATSRRSSSSSRRPPP